jgi:hypothetical protein
MIKFSPEYKQWTIWYFTPFVTQLSMKISLCIDIFAKSPMNIRSANYSSELTYNTLSMSLLTTKTDIHFIRQTYKKLKQIVKLVFKYVIFICLQISQVYFPKRKNPSHFFFKDLSNFHAAGDLRIAMKKVMWREITLKLTAGTKIYKRYLTVAKIDISQHCLGR